MLSVLIPVFNFDVRPFVRELHRQATECGMAFEIRCYDDASQRKYCNMNRELEQMENVVYKELPVNLGRSAIRNLLAEEAVFDHLLFADCDSWPERGDFISKYKEVLGPDAVLYGGRSYSPDPPVDQTLFLRWHYGLQREVIPVETRKRQPWHSFQTNNFVIPRELFLKIRLNEALKGYGHEDTLLGIQLMQQEVPLLHLDNPLRHLGLENSREFLDKTRQGVLNLARLILAGYPLDSVKLVRVYNRLKFTGVTRIFSWYSGLREKQWLSKLESTRPSLRLFDFYKLGLLCRAVRSMSKK